jgi:predicted permease
MSMGASFRPEKAMEDLKPALAAAFIKLFGLAALFLPLALRLGFAGEQIVAILVMLGSATTVSCFVMAKNMGHEGTLTSSVVMITTFGCAFSLTFWLFLLRSMGII